MTQVDILPPPVQGAGTLEDLGEVKLVQSSSRPDSRTQRYDRQLRLWASSGQSALEGASILVVNGTATAAQTLKNLVLPGIGKFTILDPQRVTAADGGNNFFLEGESSVGKLRAQEVTRLLQELNSDVQGFADTRSLPEILQLGSSYLQSNYNLIVSVNVEDPEHFLSLAEFAWIASIPLIKIQTSGFFSILRTQFKELTIVETHPESLVDLRIQSPFPALIDFAETFDFDSMDSEKHGHIPAVIILVKAAEKWKACHDGNSPTSALERKEFIASVMEQKRRSDEENFDEAVTLFRRAGTKSGTPEEVQSLFRDPACENLTSESTNFWLLLRALRNFVMDPSNKSSLLPLSGALPDMKADSVGYVSLQKVYRQKSKEDLFKVQEHLIEILASLGKVGDEIGEEEIETFVKHSAFLKVLRGRSFKEELACNKMTGKVDSIAKDASYNEVPDHALCIYVGLHASEDFYLREKRYPGTLRNDTTGTVDYPQLMEDSVRYYKSLGGTEIPEGLENVVKEICRSGDSDLPQIAAMVGGLVAQEAIKLLTRQYIPLNGSCVVNAIKSTMTVLQG